MTVAQAERSLSILARVKKVSHSNMCHDRLNNLDMLNIDTALSRNLDAGS